MVEGVDELDHVLEVFRRPERPGTTLEERVAATEARTAVRDVVLRYGLLCDAGAWDELLTIFTDDCERVLGGTLSEHVIGKEALREKYLAPVLATSDAGRSLAAGTQLTTYRFRHLITNDFVRLDDDLRSGWAAARGQLVGSAELPSGFRRGSHEATWVFRVRRDATDPVSSGWRIAKLWVYSNGAHNPIFAPTDGSSDGPAAD